LCPPGHVLFQLRGRAFLGPIVLLLEGAVKGLSCRKAAIGAALNPYAGGRAKG
jgi:hypothetical protein